MKWIIYFPFINQTQNDRYGKADPLAFWLSDQLARKLGGHLNIKTRDGLGTLLCAYQNARS